ncbi:MAG: hypothetical protein ACJ76F_06150, partial [Bacteroidia bacterium]
VVARPMHEWFSVGPGSVRPGKYERHRGTTGRSQRLPGEIEFPDFNHFLSENGFKRDAEKTFYLGILFTRVYSLQ